jgi:LysM repeat protein
MSALTPIAIGESSASVAALHEALDILDVGPIPENERTAQRYGEGTRGAVVRLQLRYGWSDLTLGHFDERCAARTSQLLSELGHFEIADGADTVAPGLWDRFQVAVPSAASASSDVAALSRSRDNMEVWWTGPDNVVHGGFWYDDGQGWKVPYAVPGPVGSTPVGGLAAVSRINTSMETWWIGSDTSVRGAFWYDDGKSWRSYRDPVAPITAAAPTSGMAALSRIQTSMEIWWVGLNGSVQGAFYYQGQNNDTWQRYELAHLGSASPTTGIAAVSRIPTAMEIWWVGPGGSVEGAFYYATDNKPWQTYTVAPDGSASRSHNVTAVSRRPQSMDVVWITPKGAVKGAFWNEGDDWELYPDAIADDGSASTQGGLAAVSRAPTSIEVWWIGPDGSVQGASWNEGVGWRRYDAPVAAKNNASKSGGIAAMSRTETTTEVWWIADDGSVQLAVRNDASGPFSFRILRPEDLVDLHFDVVGCRLASSTDVLPPPETVSDTYVVQSGDTLWDIAIRFYGDPLKYHLIAEANHLPDPNVITVGQRLTIPRPTDPPPPRSRIVAVDGDAYIVAHFGVQNIFEERFAKTAFPNENQQPSAVAGARAANPSRVVFELTQGIEIPFTASDVLGALTTLGLRVPPLAVPKVTGDDPRPGTAKGAPAVPDPDQTAIEAPYRLVVSPNHKYGGFNHAADPEVASKDDARVELWHTRLGVRVLNDGKFVRIDEDDDVHRTVRPVWARDKSEPPAPGFNGSLTDKDRIIFVRQSADPAEVEPEPFAVDRLYLSSLGAWIDWRVTWNDTLYHGEKRSAYRHLGTLGRDQYVRVEQPVYLFPFGHRGTLVTITERKIKLDTPDPAAYLYQRTFIVLRERTRRYDTPKAPTNLPFLAVSIDPVVSPDLDELSPLPTAPFVPTVGHKSYGWKITGLDHAGRQVTMTTALVAVPQNDQAWKDALKTWQNAVIKAAAPPELVHPIDVGGAEVAFAPESRAGDTTSRVQYIEFSGVATNDTSTPSMLKAHIAIPALSALNRGGGPVAVQYRDEYVANGFPAGDNAELYLKLDQGTKLDFAGASDRGGGFIEPSTAVKALSRKYGSVGDDGSVAGGIDSGTFDPANFLGGALPKLFGLFDLSKILLAGGPLTEAPKLVGEQLGFVDSVVSEYANVTQALQKSAAMLQADVSDADTPTALKERSKVLLTQAGNALQKLPQQQLKPLLDALAQGAPSTNNPAQTPAQNILDALDLAQTLAASPDLAAFLRSLLQRSLQSLESVLKTAKDASQLVNALRSPSDGGTVRYDWFPRIKGWPGTSDADYVFHPNDENGLAISVEVQTPKSGPPQCDVSAQLRDFELRLLPGKDQLIQMKFARLGFRVATGGKPEVDVQFSKMVFVGVLGFIEKLRQVIPFDGFSDPPYVDVSPEGATAGFDLALPSLAIGVFSLENIRLGADCRVPFLGDAVTVGFFFCTKESPFRLTVLAIGGGGWVGIRLSPNGLVLLEMGLEAGASLSVDLVVASGSVSVMVGVYLRLEDKKGQLTAYFRIRGEVEVLGIASASITLELSLTYDTGTGKLVGRASLVVEVEVAFFSVSVTITVERKLAGSQGDPALIDIWPPDDGGQDMWNTYYSSFAIGA